MLGLSEAEAIPEQKPSSPATAPQAQTSPLSVTPKVEYVPPRTDAIASGATAAGPGTSSAVMVGSFPVFRIGRASWPLSARPQQVSPPPASFAQTLP